MMDYHGDENTITDSNKNNDNAWDVFGSDDDDETDDDTNNGDENLQRNNDDGEYKHSELSAIADEFALHLTKAWLTSISHINSTTGISSNVGRLNGTILSNRRFGCYTSKNLLQKDETLQYLIRERIRRRGIQRINILTGDNNDDASPLDAAVIILSPNHKDDPHITATARATSDRIIPGGWLITTAPLSSVTIASDYDDETSTIEINNPEIDITIINGTTTARLYHKHPLSIDETSAPWKYTFDSPSLLQSLERRLASSLTVCLSTHERETGIMTSSSVAQAIRSLREEGLCVVRGLLDEGEVLRWGRAAVADAKAAREVILEREGVDLLHPPVVTVGSGTTTTGGEGRSCGNYRELAMREDLRVDLRDGPAIRELRARLDDGGMIRRNDGLLRILTECMNPRYARGGGVEGGGGMSLYRGNFGRWNFNRTDPESPPDPPRVGSVGFVVSFPGCGDQAIHADTPHIWDHVDDIPPHYINSFVMATHHRPGMGGTAFVAGSHRLSSCVRYTAEDKRQAMYRRIVRPILKPCDVLLFDCRILHFGLGNNSAASSEEVSGGGVEGRDGNLMEEEEKKVEKEEFWRPMMYVNWTRDWFTDPKNWDNEKVLFPDLDKA